jgi:hypothetical protein
VKGHLRDLLRPIFAFPCTFFTDTTPVTGQLVSDLPKDNVVVPFLRVEMQLFSDISTFEDETTTLPRNEGNQLPSDAESHPGRTGISATTQKLATENWFWRYANEHALCGVATMRVAESSFRS